MNNKQEFGEYYDIYDDLVIKMIPFYPEMHNLMLKVINRDPSEDFLAFDAGFGTGTFIYRFLSTYKKAKIYGVDLSQELAEKTVAKLGKLNDRFNYEIGNFKDYFAGMSKYDAITSSLAIHHLDENEKKEFFRNAHDMLKLGGIFVFADIVDSPSEAENWHQSLLDLLGEEGEYRWQRHIHNPDDKPSTLSDQLEWLEDSGFINIKVHKNWYNFYVISAEK